LPPDFNTDAKLVTYRARTSSSKTWNNPLSMTVSKVMASCPRFSASATSNRAVTPRSAAFPRA